jgi:DNA-binding response OmpR family regulator
MRPDTKHIALLCENQKHASSWMELFKDAQEPTDIQIAHNLDQLLQIVQERCPDMIILFSNKPDNGVISYLKDIRNKDGQTDETPIFIYTSFPSKDGIEDLFRPVMDSVREEQERPEPQ